MIRRKTLSAVCGILFLLSIRADGASPSSPSSASSSSSSSGPGKFVGESIVKAFVCENGLETFELITGSVYSASQQDTIKTLPGTLKLADCLDACQKNASCQSVNYETGLCILFSSSASSADSATASSPSGLQPSRFPVFTIYAQKICLSKSVQPACPPDRLWAFERVLGYELRKYAKKRLTTSSKLECMEACLLEKEFTCRSFNYEYTGQECVLSEMDRHTLPSGPGSKESSRSLLPASNATTDYFESNCFVEPNKLCDFKPIKGKILKTVDAVYPDVKNVDECKEKCISSPFRCFSFDFGDPSNSVCRTSHLDKASLSHIEEPYLEIPGAQTYELYACYNVSILCRAREMIAVVKTSKLFNGKIYAKSKPNSCVNDVSNTLDFEISMPFHDVMCDVKQVDAGSFANDIIIQHHDMIVTTQDLGLSVHCNYDLSNRSISNINLEVDGDIEHREGGEPYVHSSVVGAPNVTMSITDRNGNGIQAAQVGDPLSLRFEIQEKSSPYEILVRELVAVDGVDSSEILLIDSQGCPTDASIMGIVARVNGNAQVLDAPFDAFKFPSSDVVQFRALVTPCVPACEPVTCNLVNPETGLNKEALSYGRRRRSARMTNGRNLTHSSPTPASAGNNEEVVLVGAIKITDTFEYKTNDGTHRNKINRGASRREPEPVGILEERIITETTAPAACTDFMGLIITFIIFLIAQLTLIVAWYYVYRIKIQRKMMSSKLSSVPSSLLPPYSSAFDHHHHHHHGGHHPHHMMYASGPAPNAPSPTSSSSQASSHAPSSHQILQPHHLKFNSLYKL